jgi:type I restriction enzyme S subunit
MATLDSLTSVDRKIVYGIVQAGPHISGGIPYIRSTDIGGDLIQGDLLRTTPEIAKKYNRSSVQAGDIVFSLRGNIGETSIVPSELDGANLTQGTARISLNGEADNHFVRYALCEYQVRKRINITAKGSTFREITIEDLRKIEISLAPLDEQQQISEIICSWDSAIKKHESLIAAKDELKRGLMQQLLTGQRRFREFRGEKSRKVRLSVVLEQVTRRNLTGCHRVLTGSAEHGLIDQREFYSRRVASEDVSGYYLVKRGEFAYNRSSSNGYPFGAIKRLDGYDEGVLSTLYLVLRIKDDSAVASNFLAHAFEAGYFIAQLSRLCREGARSHGLLNITAEEFFSMHMELPVIEEQRRIAEVLSTCDREIELLQKQLEALKEQKRGLMQKLLAGEVRVKV